ncbi:unnamed protein product [Gulo gulo]|uniref:Uncharacterized protein n=1 Tax=Gulo gulo TaxID=48420 RepID=A0A9X9QAP9_GULGU|nr:unnamed protein product [Gulo gulo]
MTSSPLAPPAPSRAGRVTSPHSHVITIQTNNSPPPARPLLPAPPRPERRHINRFPAGRARCEGRRAVIGVTGAGGAVGGAAKKPRRPRAPRDASLTQSKRSLGFGAGRTRVGLFLESRCPALGFRGQKSTANRHAGGARAGHGHGSGLPGRRRPADAASGARRAVPAAGLPLLLRFQRRAHRRLGQRALQHHRAAPGQGRHGSGAHRAQRRTAGPPSGGRLPRRGAAGRAQRRPGRRQERRHLGLGRRRALPRGARHTGLLPQRYALGEALAPHAPTPATPPCRGTPGPRPLRAAPPGARGRPSPIPGTCRWLCLALRTKTLPGPLRGKLQPWLARGWLDEGALFPTILMETSMSLCLPRRI